MRSPYIRAVAASSAVPAQGLPKLPQTFCRSYDRRFQLLTFDEVIDFTAAAAATQGRVIGLVPELKHSAYFARIGLPLEDRFLATLATHDYTLRNPVEIQSFEVGNLRYLRRKLGRPADVKLLQLIGEPATVPPGGSSSYGEMVTPQGLCAMASYADAAAPHARMVIPLDSDGRLADRARSSPMPMRRGC